MPPNSDLPRNYLDTNSIKRRLLINEMTERDEHHCFNAIKLAILGNYQTLTSEPRNASEREHRHFKKRKVEVQEQQETTTKINGSREVENEKDQKDSENKRNLRYLDLVSSAASLLYDRQKIEDQEEKAIQLQQQRPQDHGYSSQISVNAIVSRTSRSSSICSEHSVYRSYEMELPKQSLGFITRRLPRPPRLPTASDIPPTSESSNTWQLNTRCYGEPHMGVQQGGTNGNDIKKNNSSPPTEILIDTVIYQ